MRPERRVVVTGIGTVGAAGAGFEAFTAALDGGSFALSEIDAHASLSRDGDPRRALLVPPGATDEWIAPRDARRMCPSSRLAVTAARMAVRDAELEPGQVRGERTAVCLGTAWGSMTYSVRLLEQLHGQGALAISPMLFTETVANAPAGQVALDLGARGANGTVSQREASGLLAVAQGAAWISAGRAERVLVGAVDELCPVLFAVLARFGALAPEGRARPFDARGNGSTAAEGATVLVLEDEELAQARGAQPKARLEAWARANDPSASPTDWGNGSARLGATLAAALARSGCDPQGIARVLSGASGARRGDALEAGVLRELFGSATPPLLAPKALVGEYGGGFLAASLWGLATRASPAALATERPDPQLGMSSLGGAALPPAERVLVSSLAVGGAAAWLVWGQA
jgi:3-oxoacyl-[acyl-carrier-protein] synthase II